MAIGPVISESASVFHLDNTKEDDEEDELDDTYDALDEDNTVDPETGEIIESKYTALLDTVGGAIHHIGNVHKYARAGDRPSKTIFTTDGCENASKRYDYETVRAMIRHQKEKYDWAFLFLGTNIDAAAEAKLLGIGADWAINYNCDAKGTALNYEVLSDAICSVREARPLGTDWKQRIDENYQKQGKK